MGIPNPAQNEVKDLPRAGILRSSELDSVGLENEAESRRTDTPGTGRKYVSWWGHLRGKKSFI